jgi:hypothetical protein
VEMLSAYLNPGDELHMLHAALGERYADPV